GGGRDKVGGGRAAHGGGKLRNEGVSGASAEGSLQDPHRREVGGVGGSGHIDVASRIHGDPVALVRTSAPEVGRVEEGGAGGIELRHEGVDEAAGGGLEGLRRRREVGGKGQAYHVGVA